jgi:holo-[acyl-carrier protein] synthase
MIKGIGIDIIEIDRIKEAVGKYGDKFLDRVFTQKELSYCRGRKKLKYPELAVRFAAKEAYSKAIGTGIQGIHWREIEVVNNKRGKPHISLNGKTSQKVHLSLSHSGNVAVASVFIEGEPSC